MHRTGPETADRYDYDNGRGKPACAWNDPRDIERVVTELVQDARTVLSTVAEAALDAEQGNAVGLLALVAGKDVEPEIRTAPGASPKAPPPTASCRCTIRNRGTCTRLCMRTATVSRVTSPWSRKPVW